MTGYIGEMRVFAGDYPPTNWAICDGTLLSISDHGSLFALIGNKFGGNGSTNFALPDMRGRVLVGAGQGPNLSNYMIGQSGGQESVTLSTAELPAHSHEATFTQTSGTSSTPAIEFAGDSDNPKDSVLAQPTAGTNVYSSANPSTFLNNGQAHVEGTVTVENTGQTQPHPNIQPYVAINWIINLTGEFPPHGTQPS